MLSHLKKEKFGYRKIRDIRISDAKLWIIKRSKGKGGAYYIAKPKMEKGERFAPMSANMANAGMDVKSLQYLMGHSDVGVTLNVYTHASYEKAEESMAKILRPDFGGEDMNASS